MPAPDWQFLERHTTEQMLDFYHASAYFNAVAIALHPMPVSEMLTLLANFKRWL